MRHLPQSALGLALAAAAMSLACGGTPTTPSNVSGFVGTWLNVDAQTRDIPQIVIRTDRDVVYVHAWGSCVPQFCDWGEVAATSAANGALQVVWNLPPVSIANQTLTLLPNGQLQSALHTHFVDGSGRADYDSADLFNKGS